MFGIKVAPISAAGGTVKRGRKGETVPLIVATGEPVTEGRAAGDEAPITLWLLEIPEAAVSTSGLCAHVKKPN